MESSFHKIGREGRLLIFTMLDLESTELLLKKKAEKGECFNDEEAGKSGLQTLRTRNWCIY